MSLKKNQLEMSSDCNFCANDLKNPGSLANKLRASNDPLSHYILDQFNSNTKQLLNKFDDSNVPSEKLKDALVDELNQLIEREHLLQDVENHAQVKLTENVKNQFLKAFFSIQNYIQFLTCGIYFQSLQELLTN